MKFFLVAVSLLLSVFSFAQTPDEVLRSIFSDALTDRSAEENLRYLCKETKGRLPGSEAAARAVEYTARALREAGADTVWLQEVRVPRWERGRESGKAISSVLGELKLNVGALGLSVGTGTDGITAGIVEVNSFEELEKIGREGLEGRIVFYNRPVDNTLLNSFAGYSGAVNQRISGASEAAAYGAAAVIVRSPTHAEHDYFHTGVVRYYEGDHGIPAVVISPVSADQLSDWLDRDPDLSVEIISDCRNLPDTFSYNVIGEIRGSELPDEYITVGGHLDSWDITEGAHDDAGGCVQSIEMIRLLRNNSVRPRRSVRAVMFMNEEMTSTGGKVYALEAEKNGEKHYAALESDRGVTSPVGFTFSATGERLAALKELEQFFRPYNIYYFERGGGGSDIAPLGALGTMQIGYIPDTQRYFWYHHSANDTFEQVNLREMQLGSAAITSLIYLVDLFDL
jgi:hypothetical protein